MVVSRRRWRRGAILGSGSSATVTLAMFDDDNVMAVKSSRSTSVLEREKKVLEDLDGCSQIIHCFGDDLTVDEFGEAAYSIFLEYAPSESLFDYMKSSSNGNGLSERQVRRLTLSLLNGLVHIHRKDYMHCDIKPHNLLIWSSDEVKITDFGLAKKCGDRSERILIRGTPLYVAPEGVRWNEYEKPSDIWSLDCTVVEMLTGEPARKMAANMELPTMLFKIGRGGLLAEIPEAASEEGKGFLRKCLENDPKKRWTAAMLLAHPFVSIDVLAAVDMEETASMQNPLQEDNHDGSTHGGDEFRVAGIVA